MTTAWRVLLLHVRCLQLLLAQGWERTWGTLVAKGQKEPGSPDQGQACPGTYRALQEEGALGTGHTEGIWGGAVGAPRLGGDSGGSTVPGVLSCHMFPTGGWHSRLESQAQRQEVTPGAHRGARGRQHGVACGKRPVLAQGMTLAQHNGAARPHLAQ